MHLDSVLSSKGKILQKNNPSSILSSEISPLCTTFHSKTFEIYTWTTLLGTGRTTSTHAVPLPCSNPVSSKKCSRLSRDLPEEDCSISPGRPLAFITLGLRERSLRRIGL